MTTTSHDPGPLERAIRSHDVPSICRLMDAGAPLPADPDLANRLLCRLCAAGDAARVQVLLEQGLNARGYFDPEEARRFEQSMFKRSSQHDSLMGEIFDGLPDKCREDFERSMREFDAQMVERLSSAPRSWDIPLFRAAETGSAACVQLLLAAGADPHVRDNSRRTAMYSASSAEVVRELMCAGIPLEDSNHFGCTPLAEAVSDGEAAFPRIRALLEAGADVNATHNHGYTVFMCAVGSERCPAVLRHLVAKGADPHAVTEFGYNAFHAAVDVNGEANSEESVRDTMSYLKELGVDMEARSHGDLTPLARAIQEGTGLEVKVLCELGANPNVVCPKHDCGREACTRLDLPLLFHAADGIGAQRDVKIEALLRAGADPLATDADGLTALCHAVASLCREAANYETTYFAFFEGLQQMPLTGTPGPRTREEFLAAATPALRAYVEKFAADIPVTAEWPFCWRRSQASNLLHRAAVRL
ncbi:MAG: ankyrin repeat domain-containing protein [Phycisphaerales bacterium]